MPSVHRSDRYAGQNANIVLVACSASGPSRARRGRRHWQPADGLTQGYERIRWLIRALAIALLLGATAGVAGAQVDPQSPVPLTPEVREGRLPNGLRYYIRRNARPQGRAELRLVVNAGSILEDDDQLGAAHFIEHMSFNGTRRFPKNELISYLQSVGIRLGSDLNANTGYDETIYILPVPVGDPQVLETGLAILREWAGNALLNEADINTERAVVLAELRSGEAAEQRVRRQTMPRMFNGSKYAARLPIGTGRSLTTMTPEALRRFYRDWYRPDLEAVIVVGEVNPDELERTIKTLFADLAAPENPRSRPVRVDIPARTAVDALLVEDAELPAGRVDLTTYVRPQPSMATIGAYDALIQDLLVNRMLGMRLYELTDNAVRPFLAAQAQRAPVVRGYEAFVASAAIAGQDPVATTRVLATEIERARRFGFTAEEFDAAKRDVLSRYAEADAERDTSDSSTLAEELGRHFLTDEPVPGIAWEFARVKHLMSTLTLDAINAHAHRVLDEPDSQPFVMVATPAAHGATEAALRGALGEVQQAEITPYRGVKVESQILAQEPKPGQVTSETSDASLGTTTLAFANGVRVILKPTTFRSDEVLLTAGRYGGQYLYGEADHQNASQLTQTVDAMGYGTLSPTALQRFLSIRRANVSVSFTPYTEELDGGSTREEIATLLQLAYLKMTAPNLDTARFEANRTAVKGYLASFWNSPMNQYDDFTAGVLSQGHPRAPRVPKAVDLDRVNPERSVAIYKERFGNAYGFTFVLVGSFAVADVKALVTQYLGGLPASTREARFHDVGLRYPKGEIERTLQTGSDNSAVTIVYSGERPYSAIERLKLAALTEVLRLRVIDRIREELGSAYSPGVSSQFTNVPVGQYALRFGIGCAPDQVPIVERTIDEIITALQTTGPSASELEKVTRTWLNEHDARARTNEYWADRLRDRALDPALDDEGPDYVSRVKALTAADVQAAARTYAVTANRARLVLVSEPVAMGR
jgi:zinc protease